jgi:transposase
MVGPNQQPRRAVVKYFAGLDVSLEETSICVVDESGSVVREGRAASDPAGVVAWFKEHGLNVSRLGLEAGPLSPWLHSGLVASGLPAVCIETRRMRGATLVMAVKTDRVDARAIAHAVRVGWYTAVHVKSAASQELRLLLRNRKALVEQRVGLDNEIRGTLKAFGIKLGAVSQARFAEAVTTAIQATRPSLLVMVAPLLSVRATLRRSYTQLHRQILSVVRADAICRRLMTVPGVGPVVALTVMTGIDDPARFARARSIGAHFGLTPRKYASGEIDRNGAISKCGDEMVRQALFQAAHTLLTRTPRWSALKAWGIRIAKRRGLRRATVAVARKLAILLHRLWVKGEDFRWTAEAA